jgi:hypothetical protein
MQNPKQDSFVKHKVDYFSVTLRLMKGTGSKVIMDSVCTDLLSIGRIDEFFKPEDHGGRGYAQVMRCPIEGINFYRYPQGGVRHCHLEIKGAPLETIGYAGIERFMQAMEECGITARASRIDVAFDRVPSTNRGVHMQDRERVFEAGQGFQGLSVT